MVSAAVCFTGQRAGTKRLLRTSDVRVFEAREGESAPQALFAKPLAHGLTPVTQRPPWKGKLQHCSDFCQFDFLKRLIFSKYQWLGCDFSISTSEVFDRPERVSHVSRQWAVRWIRPRQCGMDLPASVQRPIE